MRKRTCLSPPSSSSSSPSPRRVVHRSLSHCSCQLLPRADYDEDDEQVHWHTPHCCLSIIVSSIAEEEEKGEQEQEGEKGEAFVAAFCLSVIRPFHFTGLYYLRKDKEPGGRECRLVSSSSPFCMTTFSHSECFSHSNKKKKRKKKNLELSSGIPQLLSLSVRATPLVEKKNVVII